MLEKIKLLEFKREKLWKGCILASIAHAIMVAHYPEISNEHSWDGINYNVQDSDASRGTITFQPKFCIGAFRDESKINFIPNHKQAIEHFVGAPIEIKTLANNETLQYLLDDIDGKVNPVITTAFWGVEEEIFSMDLFDKVYINGGHLLSKQLMNFNEAIRAWTEYYDMDNNQCKLLKRVFKERILGKNIILNKSDIRLIGTNDLEALEESRISFEEMGIKFFFK